LFNTEKQLKEYGDKIPAEKRRHLSKLAMEKLKQLIKQNTSIGIDKAEEELMQHGWQPAKKCTRQVSRAAPNRGARHKATRACTAGDGMLADAEYEEVTSKLTCRSAKAPMTKFNRLIVKKGLR